MNAAIISIGDELTLGQTIDTNAAWLSQQLAATGIPAIEHITLPDDIDATAQHLDRLSRTADLVIVTGGLGPTEDDLTRHALAKLLNVELRLDPTSLEQIKALFASRNRPMPDPNNIQAMIPKTCSAIANAIGTAPGIAARFNKAAIYCMPGVPAEMKRMFQDHILPKIQFQSNQNRIILTRLIHTFGIGESLLSEKISDLMARSRNPLVNCTAKDGFVSLRINAAAQNESAAKQLIAPIESELKNRLGNLIFGYDDDTLASVIGRLLRERKATLATAESCTGGLIAKIITDIPGSSDYFHSSWVTYANAAKIQVLDVSLDTLNQHGAVSEPVARQLAQNARQKANADYALATTGIAGPTGGTDEKPVGLVYIALAHKSDTIIQQHLFFGNRKGVRLRAAYTALNILRLHLLAS